MSLFIRKPLEALLSEASSTGTGTLKRVLGPLGLIAFGVGIIVGAGLFSITGIVAADYSGPAITLSFILAAVCCGFAGLCYAEFSSMIPVAGSAYTYSYATMGELIAWIIGWDLVLEYTVAATCVSISWSQYLSVFLEGFGVVIPEQWMTNPFDGGVMNVPALLIVVVMSLLLMRGTELSSWVNDLIVVLKVGVIIVFIALGWRFINTDNYVPYLPANTGVMGEYGWSGVVRGAAVAFFAFLGFDAVSTAAQETRNPRRNMPIGIIGSLVVCTLLYVVFAHVMTGVAHYTAFQGQAGIAPVALAINHMGVADASGAIVPAYPWLNRAVIIAILFGYCSVILLLLMSQSRIFMSMSSDGLLPPMFSRIHPRYRTPLHNNLTFMVIIGLLSAFMPARVAGEMVSIGTLFAFTLVCAGVIVVRRTMPDAPRGFSVPFVPLIPVCGILVCIGLMVFLPADTWIRLVVWMLLGLDIYANYGVQHSHLESGMRRGFSLLRTLQMCLAVMCVITGFWHQQTVGWEADHTLMYVAVAFGLLHVAGLLWRMFMK